jgi:tetratricopeptide (TPR) repeat protein
MYKKTLLKTASLQGQLGTVFYLSGNFGQAVNGLQKAIAVCIIVEDKDLLASLYIDLGNVYKMQQSADKAIEYYFKALKIYEGKQNLLQVANTYNKIGGIYFDQANYEDAYNNYLIANKMHHKIGNKPGMAATINNLGEVFKMKGMKDSAAFYYSKALNLNNLMGNKSMMGINYQNLGDLFLVNNEFDKALYYFNQAISMFNETNYREALGALNISMGDYFQKQGNYTKSIDHYQKAYALSNELNDKQKKAFSARGLAISFERLGNPQKALAFYKIYSEQKDSLLSIEKHRKLTEIQTKYAYEKQRAEMQLQEEAIKSLEKSKDFNYIIRYLLGAGLLLMIIIGYLLLKRKDVNIKNERLRMDKEHELIQSKQALTEVELRNKSLEKNKLEEDLKYKTHNLMNLAMHISQKNEFLAEIKQCLKETKHLSGHDKELKISDLIIKINQQTRLNKDLKHFQTEIEQTNKEFFLKLKQVCPELTQNEKQLAALLRINLSSKEIASLNNISVKAIEMGRYRLRKKLGIENNENLTNYLQKLV